MRDELAAGLERPEQPGDQRRMRVAPLQRGVAEDEVVAAGERLDRAWLEAQPGLLEFARTLQHRGGGIDADNVADAEALVEPRRQLARSATEVDGADPGARRDEGQQVVERREALVREAPVQRRVPVRHGSSCARAGEPER